MERLGATTAVELAYKLGLARSEYDRDRARKVIDWEAGKYGPTFDHLMPMLSRAGLLTEPALRAYWGQQDGEAKELEAALQALREHDGHGGTARRAQDGRGKRA
jgi:hypothetical protein